MHDLQTWMKSGKYLPDFMRDFHDQKDLFKAMHYIINQNEMANKIGWVEGQIYTIDVFLWFMARRGYTLQRSRAKCEFLDIHKTIKMAEQHRAMQPFPAPVTKAAAPTHPKEEQKGGEA